MKKIFSSLLVASSIVAACQSALAADRNVVFTGASAGRGMSYYYFGGASALNGDIEKDGTLLRVGGGYGEYVYSTPAVLGGKVRGQVSSGDLMAGYQKNFSLGRVALYAGGNHDNYDINKPDNNNRVTGGKFGGKTQLELMLGLSENISVRNISNYSTAYRSYWTQTIASYKFTGFNFGPELSFLGNDSFRQQRIGANISDIYVGIGAVYLSAGYMKSSGILGNDGGYGAIGFAKKF